MTCRLSILLMSTFVTLMLSISCAKQAEDDEIISFANYKDSDLLQYLESFEDKMILTGHAGSMEGVTASFEDQMIANIMGGCTSFTKKIVISRYWWARLTKEGREQLMYHELGHCVLNRGHLDTYRDIDNKIPSSVMSTRHFKDSHYLQFYGDYMNELFSSHSESLANLEYDHGLYASHVTLATGSGIVCLRHPE